MTPTQYYKSLGGTLEKTGVFDMPGAFLYSQIATLKKGKYYFLGLNPGGNPKGEPQTVRKHFDDKVLVGSNEYSDGVWYTTRETTP